MAARDTLRKARSAAYRAMHRAGEKVFPETDQPAEHLVRIEMDRAIADHLDRLGTGELSAAEISGHNHASRGWKRFRSLDFPEFDLCEPLDPEVEGQFDVVICEQVLEHVINPIAAAANLRDLARPGGTVIVSTPFMIRVHELPMFGMYDYWRFTPRGLRLLLENAGLEVSEVGHWGNREAIVGNLDRWSARRRWHPMHNEEDIPVQVWAFSRRPDGSGPGSGFAAELTHPDPSQLWFQVSEIAGDRTYLRHGVTVEPGDIVIDAGANAGVAAAFFLAECGAAEVHSFEPVPAIHATLVANVGRFPGSHTYDFGLSDAPATVDFTYYEGAAAMSSRYADPERDHDAVKAVLTAAGQSEEEAREKLEGSFRPEIVTCELRTLSSVIDEREIERIDLLKIDVERAELDVLRGIEPGHWDRVRQVVAEVHDEAGRLEAISTLLDDQGFDVVVDQEESLKSSDVFILYAIRK